MKYNQIMSQSAGRMNLLWVFLFNQFPFGVCFNDKLLRNICRENCNLTIFSIGGKTTTYMVGYLPGYGTVWYNPEWISKILYLSKVDDKYLMCYDWTNRNKFLIYLMCGKIHCFYQRPKGIFFSFMADSGATVIVNDVANKRSRYLNRD